MMFVQRNAGVIVAAFTNIQPGIATEQVGATDPQLMAFLNPPVDLMAYAALKRWQVETRGTMFNGILVPTDDRAKLLLLGASSGMADGSSAPLIVGNINYGMMTKAQFQAASSAVIAHVQATFPVLASAISGINASTITTTAQIDALSWPA